MALSIHGESLHAIGKDNHTYGSIRADLNVPDHTKNKQKENSIHYNNFINILQHVVTVAALCLCTYAGVTVRIYIIFLAEWDGIVNFPSFWAQAVGTFVIGILTALKEKMHHNYIIIYTALSTGFCGSSTTFSSWNAEAAKVLLQVNHTTLIPIESWEHHTSVVGYLTVLLLGVGVPISALLFGKNIALLIFKIISKLKLKLVFNCNIPICVFPLFTIGAYLAATSFLIGLCIYYSSYNILFSLLFGCVGTYIRWLLSTFDKLNYKYLKGFPFGTLFANSMGSLILACTTIAIARYTEKAGVESLQIDLLTGVAIGLCGSLTTVSTFINQLVSLPFHIAIVYTLLSLIIVQSLFISLFYTYN